MRAWQRKTVQLRLVFAVSVIILLAAWLAVDGIAAESTPQAEPPFSDLSEAPVAAPYILFLHRQGVVNGFPDGTFRPWAALSRGQAVKMLVLAAGLPLTSPEASRFTDVPSNHWTFPYVEAAVAAGLVRGYPDETFRPNQAVSRAEEAVLLMRLNPDPLPVVEAPPLADVPPQHWAYPAVAATLDAGLMGQPSPGVFQPDGAASRAGMSRALALASTLLPQRQSEVVPAMLRPLKGEVYLVPAEGGKQLPVFDETAVAPGGTVVTGSNGSAEIVFDDGTGLRLEPGSRLIIRSVTGGAFILPDGSLGHAVNHLQIDLPQGRLVGALATRTLLQESTTPNPASPAGQPLSFSGENADLSGLINDTAYGSTIHERLAAGNMLASLGWPGPGSPLLAASGTVPPGFNQEDWEEIPWWKQPFTKRVRVEVNMPWGVAGIRGTFWQNEVTSTRQVTNVLLGEAQVTSAGQTVVLKRAQRTETTSAVGRPSLPQPLTAAEVRQWQDVGQWVLQRAVEIQQKAPAPPKVDIQLETPVDSRTVNLPAPAPPPTGTGTGQEGLQPGGSAPGLGLPSGESPGDSSGLDLLNLLEGALENPFGSSPPPPGSEPVGGGGGGGGGGLPPPPVINVSGSNEPVSVDTSFVDLSGTVTPLAQVQRLEVSINQGAPVIVDLSSTGSFSHLLWGLGLGANQVRLQLTDLYNRVTTTDLTVYRTTTYQVPQLAVAQGLDYVSGLGEPGGPRNLEWSRDGELIGVGSYLALGGSYGGPLPDSFPTGQRRLQVGDTLTLQDGQGMNLTTMEIVPFSVDWSGTGHLTGAVQPHSSDDYIEVLLFRQRAGTAILPGAMQWNAASIPDARFEVKVERPEDVPEGGPGYFDVDLTSLGIPVEPGDLLAVAYPAGAQARMMGFLMPPSGPRVLLTLEGLTGIVDPQSEAVALRVMQAGAQEWIGGKAPDPAGIVRWAWSEIPVQLGEGHRLLLEDGSGGQVEAAYRILELSKVWDGNNLRVAGRGLAGSAVSLLLPRGKEFNLVPDAGGNFSATFEPDSLPAWSWDERALVLAAWQRPLSGVYYGTTIDLGALPGLRLDLTNSRAWWPDTSGVTYLGVDLVGDLTLQSGATLQVPGTGLEATVPAITGNVMRIEMDGEDPGPVGLVLRGGVLPGDYLLVEGGTGLLTPQGGELIPAYSAGSVAGPDGLFYLSLPGLIQGKPLSWLRLRRWDESNNESFLSFYPWAFTVDMDEVDGGLVGYVPTGNASVRLEVYSIGQTEPRLVQTTTSLPGGYFSFNLGEEKSIQTGDTLVVTEEDSGFAGQALANLWRAYLDRTRGQLVAGVLGPKGVVRALVRLSDGSLEGWRLPGSGSDYIWTYRPTLNLELSGYGIPEVFLAAQSNAGGHQFVRNPRRLAIDYLQDDRGRARLTAHLFSTASTALVAWYRGANLLLLQQVEVQSEGRGFGRAIFSWPEGIKPAPGDVIKVNQLYSLAIPELNVAWGKDGRVTGRLRQVGQEDGNRLILVSWMDPAGKVVEAVTATAADGNFVVDLREILPEGFIPPEILVSYIDPEDNRFVSPPLKRPD